MPRLQSLASFGRAMVSETVPSSVCWRANSATASPILLRTDVSCSLPRHCSMRERMASRSGWLSVRKASAVCPLALLDGFEDCRLKRTAANVRVWQNSQLGEWETQGQQAHGRVRGEVNLLRKAHQQHIWPLGEPFVVQLLLGSRPLHIVRGLEASKQIGQGCVYVLGEGRHAVGPWRRVCRRGALKRQGNG